MVKIQDMVPKEKESDTIQVILNELKELNKIAVLKEEDYVVRGLLRGLSRSKILENLKGKYPSENITMDDINSFIRLYNDVFLMVKEDTEKRYVRRLIQSQEGLTNSLTELAIKAHTLADKYDKEGDNSSAIAAIKTAADVFTKVGKIQGLFNDKPEVNINMQMDKVVTKTTESDSEFKKSILKIIDIDNG